MDENTEPAGEDVNLLVTDKQAQTLGHFFINGLAGFVAYVRLEQTTGQGTEMSPEQVSGDPEVTDDLEDEFIN